MAKNTSDDARKSRIAALPRSTSAPKRKVFISGLALDAFIGVYPEEQGAAQPVKIDIELEVVEPSEPDGDRLEDVVCYNRLTKGVKAMIAEGHIKLVETLAERIASLALSNAMVLSAKVRVEKPNALQEAQSAGVEIFRTKL